MTNPINTIQAVLNAPAEQRGDLMDRTNAELSSFFSQPQNHMYLQELAYNLVSAAWADAMVEDITPRLIEVKTVGLGDIDFMEEDLRGLRAYWQGKGGKIQSGIMRMTREQMPREEMVAALDMHQDEIQTNFWGAMQKLQSQLEEKLRQLPVQRLVQLVKNALPHPSTIDGDPLTASVAATSLADTDVDPIMQTVLQHSKGAASIVGTRTAIHYLANIGVNYGDSVQSQVFNTGQIGSYKGAPVVQIENFEDFYGDLVLPNDELWIIGQNAGRLTYYGSQAKVQVLNNEAFYQRWETARDAGMKLFGAEAGRVGRIILT